MINKYYRDTLSDPGAASSDLAVDPKTMSVSGILCTASVDADGDSIEPAGIILDRHKMNPVVCLNHRSKDLPVAKAEDPAGNYTVRVKDYKLVHTAYFHDNALGAEVFKMYEARVLRGWSIAFIPLQMGMMPPAPAGRKRGSRITAGELMEYSAVTIPNNPETLAAYLGKGFHPDADAILRPMFEPFAAKLKEWANGWTPPAPAIVRPTAAAVAKSLYGPRLTARAVALRIKAFDPNEPRDETGKWTTGGGTSKKKDQLKTPAERYNVLGTRSPEFKAWFGDWENDPANASKVVYKSGDPAITHGGIKKVYHGTNAQFDSFDPERIGDHGSVVGRGFYFTENKYIAENYDTEKHGRIIEGYLAIKKPFDFDASYGKDEIAAVRAATVENWEDATRNNKTRTRKGSDVAADFDEHLTVLAGENPESVAGHELWSAVSYAVDRNYANAALAAAGYDGITHLSKDKMGTPKTRISHPNEGRVWIAFEPTQIKAVANAGTFDPNDPNIHKSAADVLARITARQLPDPANIRPENDHGTSPAINPAPAFGVPGCR